MADVNPSGTDADGDGLSDAGEFLVGSDPALQDSDGDGVTDNNEDTDLDGVTNGLEMALVINPLSTNTDNDAWPDGAEVDFGGDAADPTLIPDIYQAVQTKASLLIFDISDSSVLTLNTVGAAPPASALIIDSASTHLSFNVTLAQPPVEVDLP